MPVIIVCERCSTSFVLADELIPMGGAAVQCSRCQHVFTATRTSRPDPTQPADEVYRSAEGRMVFGVPDPPPPPQAPGSLRRSHVMLFGARSSAPPPAAPPLPPPPPPTEIDRLIATAIEHLDDEATLLVVSDALMEQGDPRGRLISLMLEEERASDLMRRVKVNVLIRDHEPKWTAPGARINGFHRGLPADLYWYGPTDPRHPAWRTARSIAVSHSETPRPSVFDFPLPRLKKVTGLNTVLLEQLLAAAPPRLESVSAFIDTDSLLHGLGARIEQLRSMKFASLHSARNAFDPRLTEAHLRTFLMHVRGLEGVRLSLPGIPFKVLDPLLASVPKLNVHFTTNWAGERLPLGVDPRRRLLLLPKGVSLIEPHRDFADDLGAMLGAPLEIHETQDEWFRQT